MQIKSRFKISQFSNSSAIMEKSFQNLSKSRTRSASRKSFLKLSCQRLAIVEQLKSRFKISQSRTNGAKKKVVLKLSKSSNSSAIEKIVSKSVKVK